MKKIEYKVSPNSLSSLTTKTFTHTGSKKYFAMRSAAQVTTSAGTTPAGCSAGGATLGK